MRRSFVVTFVAMTVVTALAHGQKPSPKPPTSAPRPPTSAQKPPTDAQIAKIVLTADNVDIEVGKLAEGKASSAKVKEFAQKMVSDHNSLNKEATELAKKVSITPEESSTSRSLKSDGDKSLAKLKKLSGAAFDKAYIDNEIAFHESVLKTMDETLTPNAKTAELKSLLETARPIFVSHLEHAKEAKASLH